MDETLTSREALEAMRIFVAHFNEREPENRRETIDSILCWTQMEGDDITFDPAQVADWVHAAVDAKAGRWLSF